MKPVISNTSGNVLVDTAWTFARVALWNTAVLSEAEVSRAKRLIADYLFDATDEHFQSFCQRILLARHYLISQPGRYIPLPSEWLNPDNKLGFTGTSGWYDRIVAIREAVPGYKTGIKAFAQALLELSNQPSSAAHYNYWKNYFIDHKHAALLSLFQATVVESFYTNK